MAHSNPKTRSPTPRGYDGEMSVVNHFTSYAAGGSAAPKRGSGSRLGGPPTL